MSGYPRGHNYGANAGGGNTGPWIGAKGSFLEGGIRVPAVLSYPGRLPRGEVRDQPITAMDWYPTILELCGVKVPQGVELDGHSVLPLIEDESAAGRYSVMHWQWQNGWMVRQDNWKLIHGGILGLGREKLDKVFLGNLDDPQPERTNHAPAEPKIVERLTKLHEEWLREVTPEDEAGSQESLP